MYTARMLYCDCRTTHITWPICVCSRRPGFVHFTLQEIAWEFSWLKVPTEDLNEGADNLLASHPRLPRRRLGRGRGAFPDSSRYPVQVPSAHRLTEAYTLLVLRDRFHRDEFFWAAMLSYISKYGERGMATGCGSPRAYSHAVLPGVVNLRSTNGRMHLS